MPRKKSIRRICTDVLSAFGEIESYVKTVRSDLTSEKSISWIYEGAIIRVYRVFEQLILHTLIGAINNDTSTISNQMGIKFPKHLSDEVCEYLMIQDGYFDFKGRDGLKEKIKKYLPENHWMPATVRQTKYKTALEQLCALRNLAAHSSKKARVAALRALSCSRLKDAGSWLKKKGRFGDLVAVLKALAIDFQQHAPR